VLLPLLLEDCALTIHVESLVKLDFQDPTREVYDAEIDRRLDLDRKWLAVGLVACAPRAQARRRLPARLTRTTTRAATRAATRATTTRSPHAH
jgi:hypothetical protein